jgi:hypothetical protein
VARTYPPRPQWNHPDAKALASNEIIDQVRNWASLHGINVGEEDRELLAVVTLAMRECPDAYAAGRYLEDFVGWPVDGELIRTLDSGYRRMKFFVPQLVHAWVMEHKVRFPAKKGDGVLCRIGDAEFKARVNDVIRREARALVVPLGKSDKPIMVNAEEVLSTMSLGSNDKGPGNFPTGGTPVAAAQPVPKKAVGFVK